MKLDKSNIDRVEHDIQPPMALAITLLVEGVPVPGLAVYVVATPFSGAGDQKFSEVLQTLKSVAANLTL
jgi:hypothetical protein